METLNEITVHYQNKSMKSAKISSSQDAYSVLYKIYRASKCAIDLKEYFFILLLNRANKVIGYHKLSEGGLTGTIADIRLCFATALKCTASGIILSHNHPSGKLDYSGADRLLTNKFIEAGKLLDVGVLDHIILTSKGYYSFADAGKM